jgi:hypothetical protein
VGREVVGVSGFHEGGKPQPKDRVRVILEGEYLDDDGDPCVVLSDREAVGIPDCATVQVLERAACGASEGMSGIACQLPKGHVLPDGSLRTVHEGTTTPEQTKTAGYEIFVRWPVAGTTLLNPAVTAAEVEQWQEDDEYPEVSGAGVPYPTQEAPPSPPSADRLPMEPRQWVADLLVNREVAAAVKVAASALGCSLTEAGTVVESMPEYQTGLNHRPVDEVELPGEPWGKTRKFRYFSKKNYVLHRIKPDGTVQFRHPDDGWVDVSPLDEVTVEVLEARWDEVGDVEPVGGVS